MLHLCKVLLSLLSWGLMQTWAEVDERQQYSDPDFKERRAQRAIFFHDGESSWWIKISKAMAKSNSNDMGPSPRTEKRALKNVIFASHGVGNGNLCPLYWRRGQYKEEKYILLLRAYFTTIKGEAPETQLSHTIIDSHCNRARAAQWIKLTIIIF